MKLQRFTYTDDDSVAVDWTTSLPGYPWVSVSHAVGGREFSAALVPSSFEIRRDARLRQTLRFTEAEWPDVRKLLEHGQRGTEITVYPDSTGASRTAYLWAPSYEDGIEPRRSDYPGAFEVDVEWVDTSGDGWDAFEFYE